SFKPIAQTTIVGNAVTVDLFASILDPDISIGSFDLFVEYDADIVGAADVDFGPYLGDPMALTALTRIDLSSVLGELEAAEDSLLSPADLTALQDPVRSLGFTLATITFVAQASGISPLKVGLAFAA